MDENGMTLLELLIAGIVFMIFLTGFSSVSVTHERHLLYVMNRLAVTREARTARSFLVADLSTASAFSLSGPETLQITFSGAPPRSASYADNGGNLIRRDSVTNTSIVVARYLDSASFAIDVNEKASIALEFKKGAAAVQLTMAAQTPQGS